MIDTHCHLDVEAFATDRDEMIARATATGVRGMLVPAIRPATWPQLIALTAQHAHLGMRCALGVHPQIVPELTDGERAWLGLDGSVDALADRIARAITDADATAVGETGLDGGTTAPELQEHLFRAHIRASQATGKPLVIHVLRAHDAAARVLREEGPVSGVMHSYSGSAELVPVYQDIGLAFSFAGPITYANAKKPVDAARAVPAELLLVETDAPDQAPEGYRGGRCEPAFLPTVIAGLAAARGEPVDDVALLTMSNAQRIFSTWW